MNSSIMSKHKAAEKDAGFTLVEFMMAVLILAVGLAASATLILGGVTASTQAKDMTTANQLAKQAMEAVFTARISGNLTFTSIYNKSQGGIFLDGFQPINSTGPDGLINTDVYAAQPPLTYIDPGKDNLYGTPDDRVITFERFQRQILISDYNGNPNLRQVTVNVQCTFRGLQSVVSTTTLLSPVN